MAAVLLSIIADGPGFALGRFTTFWYFSFPLVEYFSFGKHEAGGTMRQDVRDANGNQLPVSPSWINRLLGLVGYGKALLTTEAMRLAIGSDGAATGAAHVGNKARWPTWKEAPMSTSSQQSQSQQRMRVHIRWMIRRDMAEVLEIERGSFEFPWYEEDFIRCLRQRNCIGMVAEHGERVVGFMIYELHKTRLHILNFAVAENYRRRDVGRQMAEKLVSKLSSQRRTRISLEVRETNLAAQLFFKQLGFRATSVLRSYYEDSPEDAYLMQYRHEPAEMPATIPMHGNRIDRLAG